MKITTSIGPAQQRSTRLVFFIAGFGTAAWAPLVPFAKARLQLNDSALGLMLLCLGIGSILAMPMAGALAARFGCRRVIVAASIGACIALPLLAVLDQTWALAIVLFAFGACVGSVDCVVNIQAVIVERASGRTMMSGFHGLYSVGGIAGAAGVSAMLWLGASPFVATLVVVAGLMASLAWAAPDLLRETGGAAHSPFSAPRGVVLFIGLLCFVVFLTEGAMLDWSAVFLTSIRGVDPAQAGLGYAAFAATMTIGRLMGDRIVQRLGGVRVLVLGGLLAAAGLALATLVPAWQAALVGYALVGAGCSNIVPVLYTAVGRQTVMPESAAVPAISTMGYAGILAGPAAIGFVAHATSLPTALLMVGALMLLVAASGPALAGLMKASARN